MKKSLKVLSLTLLLFSIVACGNKTSSSSSPSSSTNATSSSSSSSSQSSSSVSSSSSNASSSSSSSASSSSSEDKIISRTSEFVAGDLASATLTGTSYEINSAFSIIGNGVTYDSGSGKSVVNLEGIEVSSSGRLKNFKQKNTGTYLQVTVTGDNARLLLQIAPSGTSDRKLTILDSEEKEVYVKANDGSSALFTVDIKLDKGTYTIGGSNGYNLYYAGLKEDVKEGKEVSFRVDSDNVDTNLFIGEELDLSSLHVYKVFDNDTEIELKDTEYTVDKSSLNISSEGDYTIDVKYKEYAPQRVAVNVSKITSIEVSDFVMSSDSKNATRLSKVYKLNDVISTDAITVTGISSKTRKVVTPTSISVPSTSEVGEKEVVVNKDELNYTYKVRVIDSNTIPSDEDALFANYYFAVNKTYIDGEIVKNSSSNDAMGFSSIQNALDFIKTSSLSDEAVKHIDIAEGTYNEKIYVESKKVVFEGSSTGESVIEFNAINDTTDARGTKFSTYGSATVTIHADNFVADNITFKNAYFNSMDEYNACTYSNKQGVAVVCDNDASFTYCKFLGFQDTLYARLGNQMYQDCLIQGMTDYIFGEKANAYFTSCEIISLNRGSETNNGYIATTKPGGTLTSNNFGFVFEKCDIKGEVDSEGNALVTEGTTSLARPWDKYSTISYVECKMDKSISKKAYGDTSDKKNARFEIMSSVKPTESSVQFKEYGNTGEGALTTQVSGGSFLTEEEYTSLKNKIIAVFYA